MNWTESEFLKDVEQNNEKHDVELIRNFVAKVKENDLLFLKGGKGKKIPTLNIYAKKLSEKDVIIGLESNPKPKGLTAWINLSPHEVSKKEKIREVRDFLGEYRKEWLRFPDSIADLICKIESILKILTS